MTREEAIEELKILREDYWDDDGYGHETEQYCDTMSALDMGIEALENQKTGHWFIKEGGNVCSNCGNTQFKYTSLDFDWRPHYCPNCGANMRGDNK